jgi:hypothetical protein
MKPRIIEVYLICLLLVLTSINALVAGGGLLIFPDGKWIGLSLSWLNDTPFHSFQIPGLLLFTFIGLGCLLTAIGLFFKPDWRWPQHLNIFKEKFWAWTFSIYCGFMLCIWIIAQQLLTDYFVLQPLIAAVGILILILSLLPRVQMYYSKPN